MNESYNRNDKGRTRKDDLTYVRVGALILVCKLMDRTSLTEQEIVDEIIRAARSDMP